MLTFAKKYEFFGDFEEIAYLCVTDCRQHKKTPKINTKQTLMKKLPFIVFCIIILSALCSGMRSYNNAKLQISTDVNKALDMALAKMPGDVVSADTIRCYRDYITIAALKDTACISMRTVRRHGRLETELVADANCGFITVLRLSDQKASGTLLGLGLLWMLGSLYYIRRRQPQLVTAGQAYGGIVYVGKQFTTASGKPIRLTPMQHSLLEMFMQADGHTLSKQDICQRLWPKKPDASATLYTLIKRIKPVIEANSNLKIESDRGRSYTLTDK